MFFSHVLTAERSDGPDAALSMVPLLATVSGTAVTIGKACSLTSRTAAFLNGYRHRFSLQLYHYCLLNNHFHLLLQTGQGREQPRVVAMRGEEETGQFFSCLLRAR